MLNISSPLTQIVRNNTTFSSTPNATSQTAWLDKKITFIALAVIACIAIYFLANWFLNRNKPTKEGEEKASGVTPMIPKTVDDKKQATNANESPIIHLENEAEDMPRDEQVDANPPLAKAKKAKDKPEQKIENELIAENNAQLLPEDDEAKLQEELDDYNSVNVDIYGCPPVSMEEYKAIKEKAERHDQRRLQVNVEEQPLRDDEAKLQEELAAFNQNLKSFHGAAPISMEVYKKMEEARIIRDTQGVFVPPPAGLSPEQSMAFSLTAYYSM